MAAGLGFKDFVTGEVLTAADVDGYLMQGVWVFASAAARDAAVTSPQEGNFAYLKDTNVTTYYTGSAWANLDTTGMTNPMTTTGDTIYSSSGSTPARLGIGTSGQVLTVSGAGIPSWTTVAGSTLPAFSAYGVSVNQTLVASTDTKVTFNTEEYDTDGCFASNRFTPTKAGYYVISAYFSINAPSAATTRMYLWKNGALYKYLESKYAGTGDDDLGGTAQVYLNGSTDYVEIYALSTQATTIYKNQEYGYFQGAGATA